MELATQYCVHQRVRKSDKLVLKQSRTKEVTYLKKRKERGARVKGEKRRGNKRSREEVKMRGARGAQDTV